jgi:hypothetical protein
MHLRPLVLPQLFRARPFGPARVPSSPYVVLGAVLARARSLCSLRASLRAAACARHGEDRHGSAVQRLALRARSGIAFTVIVRLDVNPCCGGVRKLLRRVVDRPPRGQTGGVTRSGFRGKVGTALAVTCARARRESSVSKRQLWKQEIGATERVPLRNTPRSREWCLGSRSRSRS